MTSRQEVAKKWRETGERLDKEPPSSLTGTACITLFELLESAGIRDNNSYSDVFNRLADLIDPTCKYSPITCATWFDDNDEEHEDTSLEALGNSENAYCSFCGYEMMTGEEGWFDYERKEHGNRLIPLFNYCPDCGARVVRDE